MERNPRETDIRAGPIPHINTRSWGTCHISENYSFSSFALDDVDVDQYSNVASILYKHTAMHTFIHTSMDTHQSSYYTPQWVHYDLTPPTWWPLVLRWLKKKRSYKAGDVKDNYRRQIKLVICQGTHWCLMCICIHSVTHTRTHTNYKMNVLRIWNKREYEVKLVKSKIKNIP